jgi:hypothetical protein
MAVSSTPMLVRLLHVRLLLEFRFTNAHRILDNLRHP